MIPGATYVLIGDEAVPMIPAIRPCLGNGKVGVHLQGERERGGTGTQVPGAEGQAASVDAPLADAPPAAFGAIGADSLRAWREARR